jgi:aminomethyltransferase
MQKTPLYSEHVDSGAKVVDFNGWALPVQFAGIVKEHLHTRAKASLFDCSHMGEYRIHGQESMNRYNREIISDIDRIPVGRCRYGAVLSESGGILDDLITFRMAEEELYVVTNAGPLEAVTARFCADNPGAEHVSYETAKIDIQGPDARNILLQAGFDAAETLKYFNALWTEWKGERILLSRTGYTGELGYELYMANDLAPDMWKMFLELPDVEPAGLGARDTLRLEVGYPLSGQDFDDQVTPLEAGMDSFIAWETDFVGKGALEAQRDRDDFPALVGIRSSDRRAPRHDFDVYADDAVIGVVTSGTFGPSLGHGIGLARLARSHSTPGVQLTAGPKRMLIETAALPIYTDGTCRAKI